MSLRLDPMTDREYAAYRIVMEAEYAESFVRAGALPRAESIERARTQTADLLPDEQATEGMYFFTARDGEEVVGHLWLHVREASAGPEAFGYDFGVPEPMRRRGYGRSIMLAAEQLLRERGAVAVGLTVFGDNHAARALYEEQGFVVTGSSMKKRLQPCRQESSPGTPFAAGPTTHRRLAAQTHGQAWELLESDRTPEQDLDLLALAAAAARHHWQQVGGAQELAVADWMVSRCAAATGDGPLAVRFARAALDRVGDTTPAWLIASLHEGMARAYGAAGDPSAMLRHGELAAQALVHETDAGDRALVQAQIDSLRA